MLACDNRGHSASHCAHSPALARLFLSRAVTQRAAAHDSPLPIETATTFETALVFFTKPEKRFLYAPSPALANGRARAEKWAHAESDGRSYLEVQRFNGKLALAALLPRVA